MLDSTLGYFKARFGLETSSEGATAVEYAIMVALIAVIILATVLLLGEAIRDIFSEVAESIDNPTGEAE